MKLDKFLCFKTYFFENITNQILRLNYTQLICKPVEIKNKRLCRVTVSSKLIEKHYSFNFFKNLNISLLLLATTLFLLLKVLRFHNQSLD